MNNNVITPFDLMLNLVFGPNRDYLRACARAKLPNKEINQINSHKNERARCRCGRLVKSPDEMEISLSLARDSRLAPEIMNALRPINNCSALAGGRWRCAETRSKRKVTEYHSSGGSSIAIARSGS